MVDEQLRSRDIADPAVLRAMGKVPRHAFVPEGLRGEAYGDRPLPIGLGQTISQPYIVAYMTQALFLRPGLRVLEVGTGSGYQAAVLAEVVGPAGEVFTVEILEDLARRASETLLALGCGNVHVKAGDGFDGWPGHAPYDGILLAAAPDDVPPPLLAQLAPGGVLVAPLGEGVQDLVRVTRTPDGFRREVLLGVRFVPMTGKARRR
jgi:protein-L-isoaspartate(D-aspartate) O-methyltransferase